MRPKGGLLLTIAATALAAGAHAAPAAPLDGGQRALLNDIFTSALSEPSATAPLRAAAIPVRDTALASEAAGGVFALPAVTGTGLDQSRLLAPEQLVGGRGLVVWRTDEVTLPQVSQGAVDTVRVSVGGVARAPGGVVLARPDGLLAPDAEAFDVTYTRGWPSAWSVTAGRYSLDLSPHAGFGVNSAGGTAEAGAMLRLGANLEDRMSRLGIRQADLSSFSGRGRWFLFAAASGRAVGLNMLASGQGGVQRAGWSSEPASALISDAQAGIGWSRGLVQASFGYVHRAVTGQTVVAIGPSPVVYHDSMVAFSFSIHAH